MPKRRTQEQFIAEAKTKHGDRYDYSRTEYVNSTVKVTITCLMHGEFSIAPGHHLNGVGCRKCYADRCKNSQEEVLERFRKAHGDRYDYSKVIYEGTNKKVAIVCAVHGDFKQDANAHIKGSGCPKCANENQTLSKEEFVQRAKSKHGDRYDYSVVVYVNAKTTVKINCKIHGQFWQLPCNHIKGSNCPKCAKEDTTAVNFGFTYRDVSYRSIKHACQELDKDYRSLIKRLDAGWTIAQAFDDEPRDPRHPFKVNGITYNGVEEASRKLNAAVSAHTARRRLAKGMDITEALFTPPKFGYGNGIVYCVTNLVNNKQYVGLTSTTLQERWDRHLDQVGRKSASLIHKAISEFGKDNFLIKAIDYASGVSDLREKEIQWIKALNTLAPNGYNATAGGEIGGSPGIPTTLPGDLVIYPSKLAAAKALAKREGISLAAAERRIRDKRFFLKVNRKRVVVADGQLSLL